LGESRCGDNTNPKRRQATGESGLLKFKTDDQVLSEELTRFGGDKSEPLCQQVPKVVKEMHLFLVGRGGRWDRVSCGGQLAVAMDWISSFVHQPGSDENHEWLFV
jgi:hypothetical protein